MLSLHSQPHLSGVSLFQKPINAPFLVFLSFQLQGVETGIFLARAEPHDLPSAAISPRRTQTLVFSLGLRGELNLQFVPKGL